ncbi:MAG: aminotransferase class V-fold PLP-dependent enzyme [Lachnospiraceae bacterium]|jgi:selenocysteine lyase/cysteine desulfurase|nr:aminotransferase class V-fold PLP-dependent enzyme [Lachnospiraceae bacterium]
MKKIKILLAMLLIIAMALSACATDTNNQVTGQQSVFTETQIREMTVGLNAPITLADGKESVAINLDNAATTPTLRPILEAVEEALEMYASIGRGKGQKAVYSTDIFEEGRAKVLDFVNACPDTYTTIYVGNTTSGINLLASALITSKDDIVLLSRMEHHANDLPWRHLATPIYADVDENGRLLLDDVERLLQEYDVKFVSVTAASNVTGYVNDVHEIARLAHANGAEIIVDGAQIVAHRPFSMLGPDGTGNIDYFIFAGHKMYAPFGSGAIVGLTNRLNEHMPMLYGGAMVDVVTDAIETYQDAPWRYEAGSPNYLGVVAMLRAIEFLKYEVGFDYIAEHEQVLLRRTIAGLKEIPGITFFDDTENFADKVGLLVFNIDGMYSGDVAQLFADRWGIAVRQGAFCSHPYVFRLLGIPDEEITEEMFKRDFTMPSMVRVSFGIYNNEADVDVLLEAVRTIAAERDGS